MFFANQSSIGRALSYGLGGPVWDVVKYWDRLEQVEIVWGRLRSFGAG